MRRSGVRSVSALVLILVLALTALAAPVSAGSMNGDGLSEFTLALGLAPTGSCAYAQNWDTAHYFIGIQTGNGIIIKGPIAGPLDAAFSNSQRCTFAGCFNSAGGPTIPCPKDSQN
jgi:hypothetical protein